MFKITPFRFIALGLILVFAGSLDYLRPGGGNISALSRFGMGLCFFAAFALALYRRSIAPEHLIYVKVFIALLVYIFLLLIPNYFEFGRVQGYRVTIATEFTTFSMFAMGIAMLSLSYKEVLTIYKLILAGSIAVFLISIPVMDVRGAVETANRSDIFAEMEGGAYNLQMIFSVVFVAFFLTALALQMRLVWKAIAVASIGLVFITALYYSKRAVLLDLSVAVCLFIFFYGVWSPRFAGIKRLRIFSVVGFAVVVIAVSSMFFSGGVGVLLDRIYWRFADLFTNQATIGDVNRIQELQIWWQQIPWYNKLLGSGPAAFHISGATGKITTGVHIGWANLFVKGGPPLVAFVFWIYARNIVIALRNRHRMSAIIGMVLPLYCGLSMLHSTVFGSWFSGLAVVFSLFLFPCLYSLENRGAITPEIRPRLPARPGHQFRGYRRV